MNRDPWATFAEVAAECRNDPGLFAVALAMIDLPRFDHLTTTIEVFEEQRRFLDHSIQVIKETPGAVAPIVHEFVRWVSEGYDARWRELGGPSN